MPVAASSLRLRTYPVDHDTSDGDPTARPGGFTEVDAEVPDAEMLVVRYLSAVAAALRERGIAVTPVALDGLGRQEPAGRSPWADVLCGTLNLRPADRRRGLGVRWGPTQVDWHQDTGWSARLRRGINGHLTIWRYLHGPLVPAPAVAAGFIAALGTGDDIGQPTPAMFFDRRRKILTQLGRFAAPEP